MTVKEHYDDHLGNFYSWMMGDFKVKQQEFQDFLRANNIIPGSTRVAIDLGCGNGIQSVALAKVGFDVIAVDFNKQLLSELDVNRQHLPITIIEDDIQTVKKFGYASPELIVCCGDTLTHLESIDQVSQLIADCSSIFKTNDKLILSFRDYSVPLEGDNRFIPVKSDETKILTCCLDYEQERVMVTDILNYKTENGWLQTVSSYHKVRLSPKVVEAIILQNGMTIKFNEVLSRMTTIIAIKK